MHFLLSESLANILTVWVSQNRHQHANLRCSAQTDPCNMGPFKIFSSLVLYPYTAKSPGDLYELLPNVLIDEYVH